MSIEGDFTLLGAVLCFALLSIFLLFKNGFRELVILLYIMVYYCFAREFDFAAVGGIVFFALMCIGHFYLASDPRFLIFLLCFIILFYERSKV